ncbi:hypothetical protein [Streptomyces coeruleorubidus]|uniref:hypothetical protein n=1 Tax=Streptomyces coeruleorubidus TaxID=116188 RepID=UPI0036A86B40
MTEIHRWRGAPASTAAPLRTPYQTPAIDRTPVGPAGRGNDADGAEADWSFADIPWHSIGKAARGALDAVL